MKAHPISTGTDHATDQAWEMINDLAIYQACKPYLDPMTGDSVDVLSRGGSTGTTQTFRAVVIKVEAGRAPRCTEQVGMLAPYGCEGEHFSGDHGLLGRMLSPVSRAFHRVMYGGNQTKTTLMRG